MAELPLSQPLRRIVYPFPPALPTNPYLDLLYAHMPPWVDIRRPRPARHGIARLLRGEGPALLHLHFFDELCQRPGRVDTAVRTLGFIALLRAMRLRGVRLVWTAHNATPHETLHPGWASLVYRYVARQADAIIAHGRAPARELLSRYPAPRPPFVVPQGNYVGLGGPMLDRREARRALGLHEDVPILLALGTLRRYKGIERLLDAFADLPRGVAELLIVGGVKTPEYAAELAQRVERTTGARLVARHVPDAELGRYLGAADVVVLPYTHLLTSGILLWSMSYARAVVAPAFAPVAELARDGQEGLLYTPDDPAGLRTTLERALAHPDLDALGHSALDRVRPFTWERVAAQTALVYADAGPDACP